MIDKNEYEQLVSSRDRLQEVERTLTQYREELRAQYEDKVKTLQTALGRADNEIISLQSKLRKTEEQLASVKKELTTVNNELASVKKELTTVNNELVSVKDELASVKSGFDDKVQLIRNEYRAITVYGAVCGVLVGKIAKSLTVNPKCTMTELKEFAANLSSGADPTPRELDIISAARGFGLDVCQLWCIITVRDYRNEEQHQPVNSDVIEECRSLLAQGIDLHMNKRLVPIATNPNEHDFFAIMRRGLKLCPVGKGISQRWFKA